MSDVLVVDDDPDIRSLLQIALEHEGHHVQVAAGGTAGLEALRGWTRARPVVILDVQMPDVDGWQVLETIRDEPAIAEVPVILSTVRASAADLTRGFRAGCDAYLPKPFDIAAMAGQVALLASTPGAELHAQRAERRRELEGFDA